MRFVNSLLIDKTALPVLKNLILSPRRAMSSTVSYRPDIDGLRAIAVISVVIYHAFPHSFPGGFIGVDIFFVISGYLISRIIFSGLAYGDFSFSTFYAKRIRRIFPALILILSVCYVVGWFILLAQEFSLLGKHIAAGAGFFSNLVLWSEAGYFDLSADTKPLLHLWSLGVEEQFYIFWPLLIWFSTKIRINFLLLIVLLSIISFYLNISGVASNSTATFYSPQTRFWELLAGSMLAWIAVFHVENYQEISRRFGVWLSWIGLVILLSGLSVITSELAFPGGWAILPVLGAMLLIMSGPQTWLNRTLLSNPCFVWIGLISFPLYLWHWPLLSFARLVEGETPVTSIRFFLIFLSVVLAWLTYHIVEQRVRYGGGWRRSLILSLMMIGIGGLGGWTYVKDGFPERAYNQAIASYADSIKVTSRNKECFDIVYGYKKENSWYCNLGDPTAKDKIFLFGDSHALSMLPAFERYAEENKINVLFSGVSGCPSVLGVQSMRGPENIEKYNCRALNDRVFEFIKDEKIKKIILVNRWVYYTGSISRKGINLIARNPESTTIDRQSSAEDLIWAIANTVEEYRNIGVEVVLVADNPQQLHNPLDVIRKGRGQEQYYLNASVSTDEHIKNQHAINVVLQQAGGKYINLDASLCDEVKCPLVRDGYFLYSDSDHLSIYGSSVLYSELVRALDE